ncbi:unnamed protein product [Dovyalis caffra]|uniref:TF-B3 domain-containing protein n=1 Tax=Dovyalis caffra TaxID=77055 RepID=A0AAV1S9T9_9ROSI|nr:unnamed protein product [Dovyalis caffra]
MGEETCKDCRSWEEKTYWTHFQYIQFSQFLHSGFDQRLAIPEKFARHLRKKLPDTVNLKGPSGAAWKVGLTTHNNTLFFSHGWQEFVKDHSLEETDFLIFKYNGESNFDVLMFNMQSMCEKAASYFVKKCESTERGNGCQTKRKTVKSTIEVIYASPKGVAGGSQPEEFMDNDSDAIPFGQASVSDKKLCSGIRSTEGIEEDVVGGSQQEESKDNSSDTIPPQRQPIIYQVSKKKISREIKSIRPVRYWQVVKRRGPSTCEEIETEPVQFADISDVQCIGQAVDSGHHARKRRKIAEEGKRRAMQLAVKAAVPSAWLVKHLPIKGNQDVILRFKERTWNTRFLYHKSRNTGGLTGGWKKFALDNKLHEFDVCVFEPLDLVSNPVILNVSIFRAVEEANPVTSQVDEKEMQDHP